MTDHDQIQELLAGYALQALSGQDAATADRLLNEHVPDCPECRATLDAFGRVAGDLALGADPIDPPDLLLARLHRDMEPGGNRARRFGAGWIAAAAGFVAVLTIGGLALSGGEGMSATLATADLQQALAEAQLPGAQTNDLGAIDEVASPDRSGFYLWGEHVPQPPAGQVYRLWLRTGGQTYYVGDLTPDAAGVVAYHVEVQGGYDSCVITTEDATTAPSQPDGAAWSVVPSAPAA